MSQEGLSSSSLSLSLFLNLIQKKAELQRAVDAKLVDYRCISDVTTLNFILKNHTDIYFEMKKK